MRKIHKITSIALIFMLIGVLMCKDGYALRVPMNGHKKVEKALEKTGQDRGGKIINEGWKKLAEIGDLDHIQRMDRFEFAKAIGIKEITEEGIAEKVFGVLVVDAALWKEAEALRDEFDSNPKDTVFRIKQDKIPKIVVFLAASEEVDGPGLYYSKDGIKDVEEKTGAKFEKSQFAHEYFEKVIADAGLDDKNMLSTLGHSCIEVLKAEAQFALLMGEDEFQNFLSMRTKEIKAHTILSEMESQGAQIEKGNIRKKSMRQLVDLLSEVRTDKFKQETYTLWLNTRREVENVLASAEMVKSGQLSFTPNSAFLQNYIDNLRQFVSLLKGI